MTATVTVLPADGSQLPSITPTASITPTHAPTHQPTVTVSPTPTPTPTSAPITGSQTVNFNDLTRTSFPLNGLYPAGLIDWGQDKWYLSRAWKLFTTNSISFNGFSAKSATFNFVSPKKLASLTAYNGGTVDSQVSISCGGNTPKNVTVKINEMVTISTGFSQNCTTVTLGSSNGWDTNFDNLVVN
jgi:hypothetical protein